MSSETYRLTAIHQNVDSAIRRETQRRIPDSMRLLRLKKLRLAVKDRLTTALRKRR